MKLQILRDEVLLSKQQLVVRARTILVKDDFGNDRQRYSEIYFVNDNRGENTSAIGFTPSEFEITYKKFGEWLTRHGEI